MAKPPFQDYFIHHSKPGVVPPTVYLIHNWRKERQRQSMTLARYNACVRENRILAADEHVVHKDGFSDEPGNLLILKTSELFNKNRGIKPRPCSVCGKVFTPARNNVKTCSRPCQQQVTNSKNIGKKRKGTERICVICEKPFMAMNWKQEVCKSDECRAILKEWSHS